MKTSLRKLTNALLFVGLGFAIYYAGPVVHEIITGGPPLPRLQTAPLLADSPRESAGNAYLYESLVELERKHAVAAEAAQSGFIEGRLVESTGVYLQAGSGADRRFSLELRGRVDDEPVRLLQVSNSRFLWTDLKWGAVGQTSLQQVWKVDLRRLTKSITKQNSPHVLPGQAAADTFTPGQWAGLGGLPMLLESLQTNFDFALPRQMKLRGQPVYAMVGFWKQRQRERLLASTDESGAVRVLPSRMPHHVLVLIGATDLFPYRIEYRGADDPLSAATLPPDRRYSESTRPLLKLDYLRPRFDLAIAAEEFDYKPPEGVDWMDRTNDRLDMLRKRREIVLAQLPNNQRD